MHIRIQLFTSMWIRIQLFITSRWCLSATTSIQILHASIVSLHASILSFYGPSRLYFEPWSSWILPLIRIRIQLHSYADPDPLPKTMRIADIDLFARELSLHSVHFFMFISLHISIKQRRIEMKRSDSLIHTASLASSGFRVHWPEMDLWWWPPA